MLKSLLLTAGLVVLAPSARAEQSSAGAHVGQPAAPDVDDDGGTVEGSDDAGTETSDDASATMTGDMAKRPSAAKASLPGCSVVDPAGSAGAVPFGAAFVVGALVVWAVRPKQVRVRRTARRRP